MEFRSYESRNEAPRGARRGDIDHRDKRCGPRRKALERISEALIAGIPLQAPIQHWRRNILPQRACQYSAGFGKAALASSSDSCSYSCSI